MRPALGLAVLAATLLAAAPVAAGSSIVYVKGGNVYRASPSGHGHVVVRAPGPSLFQVVTQDDRGRIWAVHYPSRTWLRFDARGRRIGRPFNTAGTGLGLQYDLGRNLPGFVGPLDPQVSGDGRLLGSWGILDEVTFINPHPLPGEPTHGTEQSAGATATFSDRDQVANAQADALLGELGWPSWLPDGTLVMGAITNLLKAYGVWYLSPGAPEPHFWFGTNEVLRIAHPEITRRGDLLAAAVDRADGTHTLPLDDEIGLFRLAGPPPAVPSTACSAPNPNGTIQGISWSPEGSRLAWADKRGVWVARVRFDAQGCELLTPRLIARGASSPDWGPR
jgi:hypothetical protein